MSSYELVIELSEPMDVLEYDRRRLDALVDTVSADTGLSEELAANYRPGSEDLYTYPGMAAEFPQRLIDYKVASLGMIGRLSSSAKVRGLYPADIFNSLSVIPREFHTQHLADRRAAIRINLQHETVGGYRQAARRIAEDAPRGPMASPLIAAQFAADMLHYHEPHTGGGTQLVGKADHFRPFVDYVLGDDAPAELTLDSLSQGLRDKLDPDLTQATLDARFGQLTASLHVDLAGMYLRGSADLVAFTLRNRSVLRLWEQNRNAALTTTDLDERLAMFDGLATLAEHAATTERHKQMKRALSDLGYGFRQMAGQTDLLLQSYASVYLQHGYPLPPTLASRLRLDATGEAEAQDPIAVTIAPAAGTIAAREAAQLVAADTASQADEVQALHDRGAVLLAECTAFNGNWRLQSRKERETLGLMAGKGGGDSMYQDLVRGHRHHSGEELIPGMSKEDATRMVDTLYMLVGLPDAEALAAELARYEALAAESREYTLAMRGRRLDPLHVDLTPLDQMVGAIRANRDGYLHLIRNRWLAATRAQAAAQFERVLG